MANTIKLSTFDVTSIKIGTSNVDAVYIGTNKVYPSTHDYSKDYFTFTAIDSGTFTFVGDDLSYSLDNGSTWSTLTNGNSTPTVSANSNILWKASLSSTTSTTGIGHFSSSGRFNIEGNTMSLLYGDDFSNQTSLNDIIYTYSGMFSGNTNVVSAENMILPATTAKQRCYANMFSGCTSLTTAPLILPATTLEGGCCYTMFYGCTSLTTAPQIVATTTAANGYFGMFRGCKNLTKAPDLLAPTLLTGAYRQMFYGCSKLNSIKCLATNISASNCTAQWVTSVASSGTFIKAANMSSWGSCGVNKIPCNWTVQNDS